MSKSPSSPVRRPPDHVTPSKQYDLFTTFFGDPQNLSNTIELWDAIPKYAVSPRTQNKLRDKNGNLPVHEQEFLYRPTHGALPKEVPCKLAIQPAHIKNPDGTYTQFYPSADEELTEEVLKKLFTDQQFGRHTPDAGESWVKFSLYMIQNELKVRGKSRSINEIKQSLEILSRAVLTVQFSGATRKMVYTNPILGDLTGVTRADYLNDPKAMWCTRLPALISKSINELTYRQFNYGTLMSLSSQLARWFHKRLSHQYTQASLTDAYHISYSSIRRDSGLLHQSRISANIQTVDAALEELTTSDVLMSFKKEDRRKGKAILDVIYTMLPTLTFRSEIKTANARQSKHRVELGQETDTSSPRIAEKGYRQKLQYEE